MVYLASELGEFSQPRKDHLSPYLFRTIQNNQNWDTQFSMDSSEMREKRCFSGAFNVCQQCEIVQWRILMLILCEVIQKTVYADVLASVAGVLPFTLSSHYKFISLDLKLNACIVCKELSVYCTVQYYSRVEGEFIHERKPKLVLFVWGFLTVPYQYISVILAEIVYSCYLGPVLAQTSCCFCSPLNIKEVNVPLTSPSAEIV